MGTNWAQKESCIKLEIGGGIGYICIGREKA